MGQRCRVINVQWLSRHQGGPRCLRLLPADCISFQRLHLPVPQKLHVQKRWELGGSLVMAGVIKSIFLFALYFCRPECFCIREQSRVPLATHAMHPCGDVQTCPGKGALSLLAQQTGWELCLSHPKCWWDSALLGCRLLQPLLTRN